MGEVHPLKPCGLCDNPHATIYAELDMYVRYRDDASATYYTKLTVCIDCSDFLTLGREEVQDVPVPPLANAGTGPTCNECGAPAVLMTSGGLKCSTHAFK